MRIHISPEACQGHAVCSAVDPALVDFDDEGHAVPVHAELPAELIDAARRSCLACPEQAIEIVG